MVYNLFVEIIYGINSYGVGILILCNSNSLMDPGLINLCFRKNVSK